MIDADLEELGKTKSSDYGNYSNKLIQISSVGSEPDHSAAHQTFKDSTRWNYEKQC